MYQIRPIELRDVAACQAIVRENWDVEAARRFAAEVSHVWSLVTLHSRNVGYGMRTQPSNDRGIEALRSQRRPRSSYCRVLLTGALKCNQWNGT